MLTPAGCFCCCVCGYHCPLGQRKAVLADEKRPKSLCTFQLFSIVPHLIPFFCLLGPARKRRVNFSKTRVGRMVGPRNPGRAVRVLKPGCHGIQLANLLGLDSFSIIFNHRSFKPPLFTRVSEVVEKDSDPWKEWKWKVPVETCYC